MTGSSDFERPARTDAEELTAEGNWSWSEAQYEHKAFQFWAPKDLLAVPLASDSSWIDETGEYRWSYLSRLELIKVEGGALSRHGAIDHSHFFESDPTYYWSYTDVRRSIFMGEFIYAISDRGISVHRTADLVSVTEEPLPGTRPEDVYWWY